MSTRPPIFGYGDLEAAIQASKGECFEPCANIRATFLAFSEYVYNVEKTIPFNYTLGEGAISEFVADMRARAYVSPFVFVRLAWVQQNEGVKFDVNNRYHRQQIKLLYLEHGFGAFITADRLFQDAIGLTLV